MKRAFGWLVLPFVLSGAFVACSGDDELPEAIGGASEAGGNGSSGAAGDGGTTPGGEAGLGGLGGSDSAGGSAGLTGVGGGAACACPDVPALQLDFVEQSLECYCDAFDCPETFEQAVAEVVGPCGGDGTTQITEGCGVRSVTFDFLYGVAYYFDAESDELIRASHYDDVPIEPCEQFGFAGGTLPDECDDVTVCSPCAEDDGSGLPACD